MEKKKGLIIDDEKEIINHVSSILSSAGYGVFSSQKGIEGIKIAREERPDFIILDIFLDDIDGGEVASRLADDELTRNIPIIYLTGLVTKKEHSSFSMSGDRYILAKPVLKGELLQTISKVLE